MEFKIRIPRHPRDVLHSLTSIEWKLPRRPKDIAIAATAAVVLIVCVAWMISALHTSTVIKPDCFTIDDGQTFFTLAGPHFAPFEYHGKEAVQAILYKGSDGRPFVGYLLKYTPAAQQALENASAGHAANNSPAPPIRDQDQLVKRPGDTVWLPMSDPKAPDIWGPAIDPKTHAKVSRWSGK